VTTSFTHDAASRRFEIDLGNEGVAYLAYEPLGDDVLDLRHTIVPEVAQGRGVGTELITRALEQARREGLRVVPTCPFVAAWLDEHPEARDLVVGR
jgi:predicted GNAT family acetyltransferase